jgi:REP element-mobilizing transposase RayT
MHESSPEFIDPRGTPFAPIQYRGELPHLYKEGGSYFVTFRLLDAVNLNHSAVNKKSLSKKKPDEVAAISEPPLCLGTCILRRPDIASLVQDAMRFFDGQRYYLAAWCVMPNHVHAVFSTLLDHSPESILHSWKSFTSHKINAILWRRGPLWERESFDHLIRSIEYFEGFVKYVEENPVAAGLCKSPADWPFSHCGAGVRCGAGVLPAHAVKAPPRLK